LLIVSPDSQASACPLSGRNSTYLAVRICGATSMTSYFEHVYAGLLCDGVKRCNCVR
jgi:hypothetical protein